MLHLLKNEMKVNICQTWIIMFDNALSNKKNEDGSKYFDNGW